MHRSLRRPARLLLVVLAFGAMAAVPTVAQATTVTSGSLELLPRASWFNYLAMFGGTTSATGSGSFNTSTNVLRTPLTTTGTTYAPDLTNAITKLTRGSGGLQYSGGIAYALPAHYIDLKLSDFKLVTTATGDTAAQLWAHVEYDPLETGTQVTLLVDYGVQQIGTVNLSGTFRGSASGATITHTWANAPLTLTADGALAFNGGTNGSYRAGSSFGSINATGVTP